MALHGLGAVAGQAMDLGELVESYLADLGTRASDAHVTNSRQALARMIEELGVRRVMDVRPADVLRVRARLRAGTFVLVSSPSPRPARGSSETANRPLDGLRKTESVSWHRTRYADGRAPELGVPSAPNRPQNPSGDPEKLDSDLDADGADRADGSSQTLEGLGDEESEGDSTEICERCGGDDLVVLNDGSPACRQCDAPEVEDIDGGAE